MTIMDKALIIGGFVLLAVGFFLLIYKARNTYFEDSDDDE